MHSFLRFIENINGNIFGIITTTIGIFGGWYLGFVVGRRQERIERGNTVILKYNECLKELRIVCEEIVENIRHKNIIELESEKLIPTIPVDKLKELMETYISKSSYVFGFHDTNEYGYRYRIFKFFFSYSGICTLKNIIKVYYGNEKVKKLTTEYYSEIDRLKKKGNKISEDELKGLINNLNEIFKVYVSLKKPLSLVVKYIS